MLIARGTGPQTSQRGLALLVRHRGSTLFLSSQRRNGQAKRCQRAAERDKAPLWCFKDLLCRVSHCHSGQKRMSKTPQRRRIVKALIPVSCAVLGKDSLDVKMPVGCTYVHLFVSRETRRIGASGSILRGLFVALGSTRPLSWILLSNCQPR